VSPEERIFGWFTLVFLPEQRGPYIIKVLLEAAHRRRRGQGKGTVGCAKQLGVKILKKNTLKRKRRENSDPKKRGKTKIHRFGTKLIKYCVPVGAEKAKNLSGSKSQVHFLAKIWLRAGWAVIRTGARHDRR